MKEQIGQTAIDMHKVLELVTGKLQSWMADIIKMLPNFILAVIIVVIFALIARMVKRLVKGLLGRVSDNPSLSNLAASLMYGAVLTVGVFIALGVLHLDKTVTSLLAGVGVLGLALGFAFQDIAANFVSGVFMAVQRPIKAGDLIEVNDYLGVVELVKLRTTHLRSLQGQEFVLPNKDIFQGSVTNYSTHGER